MVDRKQYNHCRPEDLVRQCTDQGVCHQTDEDDGHCDIDRHSQFFHILPLPCPEKQRERVIQVFHSEFLFQLVVIHVHQTASS